MERCGFFDAELVGDEYDRSYLAEQFAAYFASFIGNGVFGGKSDELQIVAMENPSMQVAALSGQGWINGYWYENTDDLYLPVEVADGVLDRIDSVVLRLGFAERDMWLTVKKGVSSNNPIAPELVRNADYYELQLATIHIKAGALNIKQADITDTRLDSNVCGFVVALLTEFDTTAFYAQLNSWLEEVKIESIEEVNFLIEQLKMIIDADDAASLVTNTVKKSGDIMTGSLAIRTEVTPTLSLEETGNGASSVFQIWNNMLLLSNKNNASDNNNYRFLSIANSNIEGNIMNAIGISDVVNGVERYYSILHAGNAHLYGLAAVPATVED